MLQAHRTYWDPPCPPDAPPLPPRTAIMLSRDHKPNRSDEKIRIEGSGGSVVWAGTWRVGGVLAVSRSFGNRLMKEFIIPHPEIREDILEEGALRHVT